MSCRNWSYSLILFEYLSLPLFLSDQVLMKAIRFSVQSVGGYACFSSIIINMEWVSAMRIPISDRLCETMHWIWHCVNACRPDYSEFTYEISHLAFCLAFCFQYFCPMNLWSICNAVLWHKLVMQALYILMLFFCPCKTWENEEKVFRKWLFWLRGHLLLSLYQYMYVHNMRDMHAIWGAITVLSNTKYGVKGAGQTCETRHDRSCSCSSSFSSCSCSYYWFLIELLQIHEVFSLHHKNACTDGQIVRLPRP